MMTSVALPQIRVLHKVWYRLKIHLDSLPHLYVHVAAAIAGADGLILAKV